MRTTWLPSVFKVLAALALATRAWATDFYVAPNGRSGGPGSLGDPWNLATALNQPASVHPGDTIWLRGGTYSNGGNSFVSKLAGTSGSPIILRAYRAERATIDGGNTGGAAILVIQGAYTWYWGFEVMSSVGLRISVQPGPWPSDVPYGEGILIDQTVNHPGLKFINLVIHDTRQGISWWKQAVDSEISGCLIFYNGWLGPDDGHGHGIYTQNQTGTKRALDNIIFYQFGQGIQAYGSPAAFLNNYYLEGNTLFQNGNLTTYNQRNLLIGGDAIAQGPTLVSNFLYYQPGGPITALRLGYDAVCTTLTLTNNYVANNSSFNCTGMTVSGNTFYGLVSGISASSFPNNTYLSSRPTGVKVFVRPNQYEAGRADITVYNWNLQSSVSVDLSGVLRIGSQYEIRNAQNFFAPPVRSGTYSGGTVSLPLTGLTVSPPVGWPSPLPTGPEFNAFVLIETSPPPTAPTSYYTVNPCRLIDTRGATGPLGGPSLADRANRTFVLSGQCGIPSTAKAIAINVVAVSATSGPGFLTIYPGGVLQPSASTINYRAGQTRANGAIVSLGQNGDLVVYCQQGAGTVNLVIDANGYFQ